MFSVSEKLKTLSKSLPKAVILRRVASVKIKNTIIFRDFNLIESYLILMLSKESSKVLDYVPAPICVSDKDNSCVFVNKAWRQFTGLTFEETKGFGWQKALHPDDEDKIQLPMKEGDEAQFELRLRRHDGEFAWVLCLATKENELFTKVIIDVSAKITQQKAAEEKAQRVSDFLTSVLEGIPDPIFVKDREHRWVEGNKAFFDMFGLPKEKLLGKSDYEFFPKEEADVFWEKDNEVFATEQIVDNFETFTHNNETRTLFTRKVVVTNPEGEKILVGAIRDISELEKIKGRLERAVQELTESNEELERFAYVASHDLQEPLRMVVNFTGLLEKRYGDKLDENAKQYIRFASDAARHMETLVDDLLEYARLDEEMSHMGETNAAEVLEYVKTNLAEAIKEKKASVVCKTSLPVLSNNNPVKLAQLLQNIIGNAIKYSKPDTAPKIEISCEEIVEDDKEYWQFAIADNGIGIDEEYYKRIFNPFKRLHSREEYPGTGIGLAICKKIAEAMNGDIKVESKLDEGSTFYFTIPKMENDILSI